MERDEKKAHIAQIKNIMRFLDYFETQFSIDTFDAKTEIAKIESQITNIYQESNTKIVKSNEQ
tara:strand:+ start:8280 stop:8468 length:189 start_codon:yes stop_codon:yes gene_type:complete